MTQLTLPYGASQTLSLEAPEPAWAARFLAPPGKPLADPAAATAAALVQPLGYPPLVQATVPGDQVLIALGDHVPQAPAIVAGVVHALREAGVSSEQLTLLHTGRGGTPQTLLAQVQEQDRAGLCVVEHDANSRGELSYLAASEEGLPIYLNRHISDADVVLSIGCLRVEQSLGWTGIAGGFFSVFSDQATRERFAAPTSIDEPVQQRRRRQEAEEVAWMLGLQCTVQVIAGGGNRVMHVVAGETGAAYQRGRELCQAAWSRSVERPAELVIASLTGDAGEQTWDNLARAIFAARGVVAAGGAIVLCTELDRPLDPALRHLRAGLDLDDVLRGIRRERTPGAAAASQLAQAIDQAQVYLLSGLSAEEVEELGIGYVEQPGDIQRLLEQRPNCTLLAHAQHAVLTLGQPAESPAGDRLRD